MRASSALGGSIAAALALVCPFAGTQITMAAIIPGDPIELAVAPRPDVPDVVLNDNGDPLVNGIGIFASDQYSYDDNIYRLPGYLTDLSSLGGIGANASRSDRINTASAGADGQWTVGRQNIAVDLAVNDNRYDTNSDLNNVSSNGKVAWNWDVGSALSGQAGATYSRQLISFVNAPSYGRILNDSEQYWGAGRFQLGPHWGIFGGVMEQVSTLSEATLVGNDLHAKSVAIGADLATSELNKIGAEYRYTDATYPHQLSVNDDYREDAARVILARNLSDKTTIDASVGFLKRDYADFGIESFSGVVYSLTGTWQPTEKLQLKLDGWRNLQAYVTTQSDYFVSKGVRLEPIWSLSEKINIDVNAGIEGQSFIGTGLEEAAEGDRRDTLTTFGSDIKYKPIKFVILEFGYSYERHASNEARYGFNDNTFSLKVTVRRLP